MATHEFRVVPGISAPSGAPMNPLANIRPAVNRPARISRIIDSLTGSYTLNEKSRLDEIWFTLFDAGVLDALDGLFLPLRNAADSLINWAGTQAATVTGATFSNQGWTLDGVDDFLDMQIAPLKMRVDSACAFGDVLSQPSTSPSLIGRVSGADLVRITLGGSVVAARLNGPDPIDVAHGGNRVGLWAVQRSGSGLSIYRDGVLAQSSAVGAPTALPTSLAVGRLGSTFSAVHVGALGYGRALSSGEHAALHSVITALKAEF